MDPWASLESLLETDSIGVGCAENLALIHTYAEMIINGDDADAGLSALTAHLRQCPPCDEDLRGLVQAVRENLYPDPSRPRRTQQAPWESPGFGKSPCPPGTNQQNGAPFPQHGQ